MFSGNDKLGNLTFDAVQGEGIVVKKNYCTSGNGESNENVPLHISRSHCSCNYVYKEII